MNIKEFTKKVEKILNRDLKDKSLVVKRIYKEYYQGSLANGNWHYDLTISFFEKTSWKFLFWSGTKLKMKHQLFCEDWLGYSIKFDGEKICEESNLFKKYKKELRELKEKSKESEKKAIEEIGCESRERVSEND